MWIAFKNYYLRDTTQHNAYTTIKANRCELLSKIIIFVTRHNDNKLKTLPPIVVNCFQKLLSSWHDTTPRTSTLRPTPLWIAFKNYYLRDTTQRNKGYGSVKNSCELLSKIIIFVTRHNLKWKIVQLKHVVNCFQKLLSSWHDTTLFGTTCIRHMLWIAFKNYYLRDTTQLSIRKIIPLYCCELLSKIIIFVTRHN